MKIMKQLLIFTLALFIGLSLFSGCEEEDDPDALGRVANESIYDLEDIVYGDVEVGDCDANETTDYVGIPLQSERLEFGVSGYSGTVETDRLDTPEKGKKYTIEITSYTSSYYGTITFYYGGRQYPRFKSWKYATKYDQTMAKYYQLIYAIEVRCCLPEQIWKIVSVS